jgi:hypothetical protein
VAALTGGAAKRSLKQLIKSVLQIMRRASLQRLDNAVNAKGPASVLFNARRADTQRFLICL